MRIELNATAEGMEAIVDFTWRQVVALWDNERPEAANFIADICGLAMQQARAQAAGIPGAGTIDFTTTNLEGRAEVLALAGKLCAEATARGNAAAADLFRRIESTLRAEAESRHELEKLYSL